MNKFIQFVQDVLNEKYIDTLKTMAVSKQKVGLIYFGHNVEELKSWINYLMKYGNLKWQFVCIIN